jgi:hypothetical protein
MRGAFGFGIAFKWYLAIANHIHGAIYKRLPDRVRLKICPAVRRNLQKFALSSYRFSHPLISRIVIYLHAASPRANRPRFKTRMKG